MSEQQSSVARQVASYERLTVDPGGPAPQLFIREMFVPAIPALRRTLDLLWVGFIECGEPDGDRRGGELVLFGPEKIREHSVPSAAGLTVTDLTIGSTGAEAHAASMLLMRITRTTRAHDILISIEDLGRLLERLCDAAYAELTHLPRTAGVPVVVTSGRLRGDIRTRLRYEFPELTVVSYDEIPDRFNVQPVARLSWSS